MSAQTGGRQPARRLLPYIPLIDRYIAMRTLRPFALSLGVVLAALLLERVLRLFDLLALKGGPYSVVIELAASLVPYYLGLALPAAFFLSVFLILAAVVIVQTFLIRDTLLKVCCGNCGAGGGSLSL